jgi:ribonuclease HII
MDLRYEEKLFSQGYEGIAGADEAGRGSWAGPIVAAAFFVQPGDLSKLLGLKNINDSKVLSVVQRQRIFDQLVSIGSFGVSIISSYDIDVFGLGAANKRAMYEAVDALAYKPDYIMFDGRGFRHVTASESIVDGDAKVFCIASASIIAKVTRDVIMQELDKYFPAYGFAQHKGYGTRLHQEKLRRHGVSPIHRMSFAPVAARLQKTGN